MLQDFLFDFQHSQPQDMTARHRNALLQWGSMVTTPNQVPLPVYHTQDTRIRDVPLQKRQGLLGDGTQDSILWHGLDELWLMQS